MHVQSLGWENPLEEEMITHSRILAWRTPGTEEPGGLQSIESQRVKHNCSNLAHMHTPSSEIVTLYYSKFYSFLKLPSSCRHHVILLQWRSLNEDKKCVYITLTPVRINGKFLPFSLWHFGGSDNKESAWNAGDPGSIPGLGRSPGEGNGNPLQYSCLENSMDRVYSPWVPRVGHEWVTNFHFHYLAIQYVIFCKCRRVRSGMKICPCVLKSWSLSVDSCSLQSLHGSLHGLASLSSPLSRLLSLPPQDV